MLGLIAYLIAAASALAAAAFGLAILLGGSAHLGKEAAIAADKVLQIPGAQTTRGTEVGAATAKTTGSAAATEAKPAQPGAAQKPKAAKSAASSKRKKRNAATRSARRN